MSLTAQHGDPLLEVHPLITTITNRVIKLRALVMRSPNHTAKRIESFAKLNQKPQLYQAAMECFQRSLVYHNRRFAENILETDLVNLDDKSEEVELGVALKQKQRNRERLDKRKAKSLAEQGSKPLPEGELKEGQIYHLVNGRLVVYDQAHLSTDQASSGTPPEAPSAITTIEQPKLYAEITGQELSTESTSTGLEESLAK